MSVQLKNPTYINRLLRIYASVIVNLIFSFHVVLNGQMVSFTYKSDLINTVSGFTAYADCAVDMNGDYLDDVVRVGEKGLYIDYQEADGAFFQKFFPVSIQSPPQWSVCAGDLDNNGFNDLLFADTEHVSFLKANQDGTMFFETMMPVSLICQRSTIADIDNDGWLDAFVCNDTSMSVPFRNVGMGIMMPDTNLIQTSRHPGSYSAIWTDFDNDLDMDLYISKCKSGAAPGNIVRTNLLYQNNGNGSFSEVAAQAGIDDNAQSWSTVFEDFDNDGDMDAFIVNHDFKNRLFRNNGNGTFTDVIASSGIDHSDLGAFENAAGDFNNDGFMDIFSELTNELYIGNGDLTFSGHRAPSPPGAIADLNNDGFLDVTKNGQVWLNDGNSINHWLKVNLFGLEGNRNGIGARVEVYNAGGIQIREVRSGQSYSPMNSLTVHFGLGTHEQVDSMKIKWPSGTVTVMENLRADTSYLVPETTCLLNTAIMLNDIVLCTGDTVLLQAPTGFTRYVWSNGDTTQSTRIWDAGKYFVVLTDMQGCVALASQVEVRWAQDLPPTISADPGRRLCHGESIVLSASGGQNPSWSNGMKGDFIIVSESGNYTVAVDAHCTDGQLISVPFAVEFLPASPPVVIDAIIGAGDSILLSVDGENCHWYEWPLGGNLLHIGCDFQTPALQRDTIYYVENHPRYPMEMQSGGMTDTISEGGVSLQTGFMLFEAWEPFVLKTVRVYLPEGVPEGLRFIQLFSHDTLLAFKQFQVATGWNELDLDFDISVGKFSLHCPFGNLFRSSGSLNYPYQIGDVGQITGSSFGLDYYYYFYDWKILKPEIECASQKIPVNVTVTETENPDLQNTIEVFPNPTSGELTIKMGSTYAYSGVVRLFSTNGSQVCTQKIPDMSIFSLNIHGLATGIYWLQIQVGTELLIKKVALI